MNKYARMMLTDGRNPYGSRGGYVRDYNYDDRRRDYNYGEPGRPAAGPVPEKIF